MGEPYVTNDEYIEAMHISAVPDNFEYLLDLASEYMDEVTNDYYQYHDLSSDRFTLRAHRFKRAVIRQIDYMATSGITSTEQAKRQPVSGTKTIGRTTVTQSWENAGSDASSASVISADALAALRGTGLLYRGIRHV